MKIYDDITPARFITTPANETLTRLTWNSADSPNSPTRRYTANSEQTRTEAYLYRMRGCC